MGVQVLGGGGGGKANAQEGEVKRLERVDGKLRSQERIRMVEMQCAVVAQRSGGSCAGSKEDGEATSRSVASGVEGAATVREGVVETERGEVQTDMFQVNQIKVKCTWTRLEPSHQFI
jgi:hypothetical protein